MAGVLPVIPSLGRSLEGADCSFPTFSQISTSSVPPVSSVILAEPVIPLTQVGAGASVQGRTASHSTPGEGDLSSPEFLTRMNSFPPSSSPAPTLPTSGQGPSQRRSPYLPLGLLCAAAS